LASQYRASAQSMIGLRLCLVQGEQNKWDTYCLRDCLTGKAIKQTCPELWTQQIMHNGSLSSVGKAATGQNSNMSNREHGNGLGKS
jgi:hypothetical protein